MVREHWGWDVAGGRAVGVHVRQLWDGTFLIDEVIDVPAECIRPGCPWKPAEGFSMCEKHLLEDLNNGEVLLWSSEDGWTSLEVRAAQKQRLIISPCWTPRCMRAAADGKDYCEDCG